MLVYGGCIVLMLFHIVFMPGLLWTSLLSWSS